MDLVATDAPHVLVVTGMSGAGRSSAANVLEDIGYTVIDNLPPQLLSLAVQAHDIPEVDKQLAVVIDSRGGLPIGELRDAMTELEREGVITRIVFLDADDDVIVSRYEENRRPHPSVSTPSGKPSTPSASCWASCEEMADVVIDTSNLNVHELRERLTTQFSDDELNRPMRVSIRSFGFKHGAPRDTDLVLDVRFLPNPHWVAELRDLRGTNPPVSEYVLGSEGAGEFMEKVDELLEFLIPRFQGEGKSYLSIGIGCTGGHHRSVAIAEELRRRLSEHGINASVRHRDMER